MEDVPHLDAKARSPLDLAMDRYADGASAAFAPVYDELAPRLRQLVRLRGGSAAVADDVVQTTMLRLIASRDRWVRGSSVVSYAVVIARRCLVDLARRGRLEVLDDGGGREELHTEPASDARLADEEIAARRRDAALRGALARLPEHWRRPFELVRMLDCAGISRRSCSCPRSAPSWARGSSASDAPEASPAPLTAAAGTARRSSASRPPPVRRPPWA
jgi:RNA polymerase sigma factor (sigma-70 family)